MLLAVGRMKQGPERDLLLRYVERATPLARQLGFNGLMVREVEEGRGRQAVERKRAEARALQAEIPPGSTVYALDERGSCLSSADFATAVGRARDAGEPALVLVIGGPDGLDAVWQTGPGPAGVRLLSYGRATFPHQLVRVLAAEQLYRALTILGGHPYHRA